MSKVNKRNSRKRCEICSKLTIKASERCQWHCGIFTLNFQHISHFFLFPLLTFNKLMLAGKVTPFVNQYMKTSSKTQWITFFCFRYWSVICIQNCHFSVLLKRNCVFFLSFICDLIDLIATRWPSVVVIFSLSRELGFPKKFHVNTLNKLFGNGIFCKCSRFLEGFQSFRFYDVVRDVFIFLQTDWKWI